MQDGVPAPDPTTPEGEQLIHHDNTFGTPEEDAFRRDFTINALFYDIATFSIIDYVGGLEDLRAGVVRSIGDPDVRLRRGSGAHAPRGRARGAARLHDRADAARRRSARTATRSRKSSPPRLLEEYYKILRAGSAEKTFRELAEVGLLEPISAELHRGAGDPLWRSLAALDAYRRQFESTPDTLTNAILLGSLLVPLGISLHPPRRAREAGSRARARNAARTRRARGSASCRSRAATSSGCGRSSACSGACAISTREPARAARARAPRHLPRGADLDGDPRRRAGGGRALDGDPRRERRRAEPVRGRGGDGSAAERRPADAAQAPAAAPARGRRGGGGHTLERQPEREAQKPQELANELASSRSRS